MDEGDCRTFQVLKERFWNLLTSSASNGWQREISEDLLGYWAEENVPGDIWLICNRLYRSYKNFSIVVPLRSKRKKNWSYPRKSGSCYHLGVSQNFWQAPPFFWCGGGMNNGNNTNPPILAIFSPNPSIRQNFRPCPELYRLKNSCRVFSLRQVVFSFPSQFLGWVGYSFV